ncbi:MAG: hypothetical protein ACTHOE_10830 [Conexibacter sp.]
MRIVTTFTILLCVLLALPAGVAWANAADDRIIEDCQSSPTGALTGSYSQQQLNHAFHHLPGDIREYTGCPDAIKQALIASVTGDGGGGGKAGGSSGTGGLGGTGGGTTGGTTGASGTIPDAPPPPGADRPQPVAGSTVVPGALPELGRDTHRLPTSLLVLLALLAVAALVPAALTIGRRVVGHRNPS